MSVCEVKHSFETNIQLKTSAQWPQMSADDHSDGEDERRRQQYALHCAVFHNDLKLISHLLRNYDIQLKDIHGLTDRSPPNPLTASPASRTSALNLF